MSIELKIKSKHLAEEAKIIKLEERRQIKKLRYVRSFDKTTQDTINEIMESHSKLHKHRVIDVCYENRATFLARAYLAGKPYSTVENTRKNDHIFKLYIIPRVANMVAAYSDISIEKYIYVWDTRSNSRKKEINPAYTDIVVDITAWAEL